MLPQFAKRALFQSRPVRKKWGKFFLSNFERSKLSRFKTPYVRRWISVADYEKVHKEALSDPIGFWSREAEHLTWDIPSKNILDETKAPFYEWFKDGKLNMCYNAVDRHIDEGRGDDIALIYDSPVTDRKDTFTFSQLREKIATLAGVLVNLGVEQGDRVLIYLPMIPESVIAMLACARVGAIHSVVFGGFASLELAVRIDDAKPKVILSSSCGIEGSRVIEYKPLLDEAIRLSQHKPTSCLIHQRPQSKAALVKERDIDWEDAVAAASPHPCVSLPASHPLYILYTSGTTGTPKGVLRDTGGYAVALHYVMRTLMECGQKDVFFASSDVGWVVGHTFIVYGPLISGCTTVLFEGKPVGTPDAGAFWRIIEEYKVRGLFAAPTALRAIRREDPEGTLIDGYDISSLKGLFMAGERADPATCEFFAKKLNCRVVDNWWQTETGWPVCGLQLDGVGMKSGSTSLPLPGYDVQVIAKFLLFFLLFLNHKTNPLQN